MYEASRGRRACAVDGCNNAARSTTKGIKLCRLHAVKEEKTATVKKTQAPTVTPPEPEARSEPGPPVAVDSPGSGTPRKTSKEASGRLASYLRPRMAGESHTASLLGACPEGMSLGNLEQELRKAAKDYLSRLPAGYPENIRSILQGLAAEEQASPDPVLSLAKGTQDVPEARGAPLPLPAPERPTLLRPSPPDTGPSDLPPALRADPSAFFRPRTPFGVEAPRLPFGGTGAPFPRALAQALRPSRAGAFTEPEPRTTDEATKALQSIAKAVNQRDEAAGHEKGKLAAIGKTEERLAFLLRGCDSLTVSVCACTVGKELFHALKTAGSQGRPQMRALQFPVNISNRIAYGFASLSIGGRDVKSLPEHCLSVADFPLTSEEDFDNFVHPADNKLERKPRHPTTLTAWFRSALRMAWAFACVFGAEHYATLEAAATKLLHLGESATYAWPLPWLMGVWEELWARMIEEVRQIDRELRRLMGEDAPNFERVRFFATSPDERGDPWLRLPRTFDLDSPDEFFQTDVLPRQERALTRSCWQQALKSQGLSTSGPAAGGRAGGEEAEACSPPGPEPPVKAGKDESARVSRGGSDSAPPNPPKLLGPSLTTKEASRALDHRPKSRETGAFLCWDHISHRGCSQGEKCPHAHPSNSQIPTWSSLDWSVQLQLLRRQGLKTRPKVKSPDAAMAALRKEVAKKQEENVAEGLKLGDTPANAPAPATAKAKAEPKPKGRKPRTGGKAGASDLCPNVLSERGAGVPEEFAAFAPTEAEEAIKEWAEGPDYAWYEDCSPAPKRTVEADVVAKARVRPGAAEREQLLSEVQKVPGPERWPSLLATFVRGYLTQHLESNPSVSLGNDEVRLALEKAAAEGGPELATQAEAELELLEPIKAGEGRASFTEPVPEQGRLVSQFLWEGHSWPVYDFGDKLPIDPEVRDAVRQAPPNSSEEARQCLLLHCVAAVLARRQGVVPSPEAVKRAAQAVRKELLGRAVASDTALGPLPGEISRAEADLRIYAHDLRHWSHDKDYRCLAAYPLELFRPYRLLFLRVDPRGRVTAEEVGLVQARRRAALCSLFFPRRSSPCGSRLRGPWTAPFVPSLWARVTG